MILRQFRKILIRFIVLTLVFNRFFSGNVLANELIELEMDIPLELQGNENYRILRVHEDLAEELDALYNPSTQTIRFETDKFSTYALVYDPPLRLSAPMEADLPNTDGPLDVSLWFGLMGLVLLWMERRLRQEKMS